MPWTNLYWMHGKLHISSWRTSSLALRRTYTTRPPLHLGAWVGWRKYTLSHKIVESEEIISFHLKPSAQGALPPYETGQFISVRCYVPELGVYQPRQYSLSDIPDGKHLRISVKREYAVGNRPAGRISNVLHETLPEGFELDVSMPFGDFTLDTHVNTPVVLMSGGVGLTPMMSMLKTIVAQSDTRPVVFVHAVRTGRVHAMKGHLSQIMSENPQVSRAIFYEEVSNSDVEGKDYDFLGRIELNKIRDLVLIPDAEYYLCGPKAFMDAQRKDLKSLGVQSDRIHSEVFGAA